MLPPCANDDGPDLCVSDDHRYVHEKVADFVHKEIPAWKLASLQRSAHAHATAAEIHSALVLTQVVWGTRAIHPLPSSVDLQHIFLKCMQIINRNLGEGVADDMDSVLTMQLRNLAWRDVCAQVNLPYVPDVLPVAEARVEPDVTTAELDLFINAETARSANADSDVEADFESDPDSMPELEPATESESESECEQTPEQNAYSARAATAVKVNSRRTKPTPSPAFITPLPMAPLASDTKHDRIDDFPPLCPTRQRPTPPRIQWQSSLPAPLPATGGSCNDATFGDIFAPPPPPLDSPPSSTKSRSVASSPESSGSASRAACAMSRTV
jgi:hypothetical protein